MSNILMQHQDLSLEIVRDWQAIKLRMASDHAGLPEARAFLTDANRYGAIAEYIETLLDEIALLKSPPSAN